MSTTQREWFVVLRVLVAAMVAGAAGCSRGGRTVVLGVCGLPPQFLDEIVAQGNAPNFARLYREGAVGRVSTAAAGVPPVYTHIWTSYATGQLPDRHRILGFVDRRTNRLVESTGRRVPAIWEIASEMERRVGVVNWPVSYPAEAVRGFVITDRFLETGRRGLAAMAGVPWERDDAKVVFPPELGPVLDGLGLRPGKVPNHPHSGAAADRDQVALASAALTRQPVDLLLIFIDAFDQLGHLYWDRHEPLAGEHPERDFMLGFARSLDGLVGEVLKDMEPADHIVVLSDHGMERGSTGPFKGVHASRATAFGVIVMRGPRITPGIRLADAGILDVLPTLLELVRIPASVDLPGQVIAAAFRDGPPLPRRPPYEKR